MLFRIKKLNSKILLGNKMSLKNLSLIKLPDLKYFKTTKPNRKKSVFPKFGLEINLNNAFSPSVYSQSKQRRRPSETQASARSIKQKL